MGIEVPKSSGSKKEELEKQYLALSKEVMKMINELTPENMWDKKRADMLEAKVQEMMQLRNSMNSL